MCCRVDATLEARMLVLYHNLAAEKQYHLGHIWRLCCWHIQLACCVRNSPALPTHRAGGILPASIGSVTAW